MPKLKISNLKSCRLFLLVLGALAFDIKDGLGFLLTVLIDATQNPSGLKYIKVEVLNSGASSPILLIMFSDIWGILGFRKG